MGFPTIKQAHLCVFSLNNLSVIQTIKKVYFLAIIRIVKEVCFDLCCFSWFHVLPVLTVVQVLSFQLIFIVSIYFSDLNFMSFLFSMWFLNKPYISHVLHISKSYFNVDLHWVISCVHCTFCTLFSLFE